VSFDERNREPARDGVQCYAGTDDAAADDEDVELDVRHLVQDRLAIAGSELS
jgi:hypothetical protein